MKLDISEITTGKLIGKKVFACGKRGGTNSLVTPTEFMIRDNSETQKRVYYSECFLSPLKKDGSPLAKYIPVYDTTGYRTYPGNPLHFFDNLEECEYFFKKEFLNPIDEAKKIKINQYLEELKELGYTIIYPTK